MEEFEYLDLLFLLFGCKIFRSTPCINTLNVIMRVIMLSCYAVTVAFVIQYNISVKRTSVMHKMDRYSDQVCGLISMYVLCVNRKEMEVLMSSIITTLSAPQKAALKRFSLMCMMLILTTILQGYALLPFRMMTKNSMRSQVFDSLKSYHNMNSWFLSGCCLFVFFVKVVQFSEANYFENLERDTSRITPDRVTQLAIERWNCLQIKKNLIKTFSIIPCLWFAHIFIKAPAVVIEVSESVDPWSKVWRILPFLYEITAITYVVYHCDACADATRKRISDALILLMKEDRMTGMDLFVDWLERGNEDEFMTWKTVAMNRRFMLGFICSLVSFALLFKEVTELISEMEESDRSVSYTVLKPILNVSLSNQTAPFG